MSVWLSPLNLQRNLRILSPNASESIDDWTAFLIWAGWWMRRTVVKNTRIFLVLLLPTRICCSAFCALGALIGSVGKLSGSLTWEEFAQLPHGTKLYQYFRPEESIWGIVERKIEIGGMQQSRGQIFRRIYIGSGRTRSQELVHEEVFHGYHLFLDRLSSRGRLGRITKFFKDLKSPRITFPMVAFEKEYLIVANKTDWKRQIADIRIAPIGGSHVYPLPEILMPCERDEVNCPGFLISSRGTSPHIEGVPLAILDGPDSLKAWEKIPAPNIIVLLDRIEYDQNSQGILGLLASARDDRRLPAIEGFPDTLPDGIELSMFAFGQGGPG